jgi:hypothetical protein
MSAPLTSNQRRTEAARAALAAKFSTPEQKREHYRALGQKSAEGRIVLSGDQAQELSEHTAALARAYAFLSEIAARNEQSDSEAAA